MFVLVKTVHLVGIINDGLKWDFRGVGRGRISPVILLNLELLTGRFPVFEADYRVAGLDVWLS
jgi:hypothetical protein